MATIFGVTRNRATVGCYFGVLDREDFASIIFGKKISKWCRTSAAGGNGVCGGEIVNKKSWKKLLTRIGYWVISWGVIKKGSIYMRLNSTRILFHADVRIKRMAYDILQSRGISMASLLNDAMFDFVLANSDGLSEDDISYVKSKPRPKYIHQTFHGGYSS